MTFGGKIGVIVLVPLLGIGAYFYVQNRMEDLSAGICLKEGRVLPETELKRRAAQSLVMSDVSFVYEYNKATGGGSWRVGLSPIFSLEELRRLIRNSISEESAYEDVFSIAVIRPNKKEFEIEDVPERFMLHFFNEGHDSLGVLTSSESIQELEYNSEYNDYFKIGVFDEFNGYGNYFFYIDRVHIDKDCCDKKPYTRTQEEYEEEKRKGISWSIKNLEDGGRDTMIAVSNCGGVLTRKGGNGIQINTTFYIGM